MLLSHVDSALGAIRAFADLVFFLELDGTILECKADESVISGQSASNLVRKKIQDIFPSPPAEVIERHLSALSQSAGIIPFEFSLPAPDYQRWYDAQVSFLPPSGAILLARDITAHKLTQLRMQQQLRQLSALRSIDLGIASGLDLKLLLSMLLDKVTVLLHVDAACVLLLNHETNTLHFSSGKGFKTGTLQSARV